MAKNEQELRVTTPVGEIVAYPNVDPERPGMTIMLKPKGKDVEIDLFYCMTEPDNPDVLKNYTYENPYTEDYTRKFHLDIKDILKALPDEEY